ncbi:SdpI family protein [Dietzia kunjamensis]|jgi:hypothetical protein|uniref:SdpI family protein n=1 Tax=Dietzia TaxID=37914 RepID=UPI0022B2B02D|nr:MULTISPECIES: SdpI family protein [Dietzia]MBB0992578.1 SdpI family protein [Dietzia sp. SLG510A3-30A2]MCZ4541353.1 SdpI family protein [Dietzia maris]MDJ0423866.1 SdpI family protein [Dietzia kunjamensis]
MESSLAGLISLLIGVATIPAALVPVVRMAARGDVGRNGTAGIRTRFTRASDDAWRAGHAAALPLAKATIWIAVSTVAISILVQATAGGMWGFAAAACGFVAEIITLLVATREANKAARSIDAS